MDITADVLNEIEPSNKEEECSSLDCSGSPFCVQKKDENSLPSEGTKK
jgi:hypothetical protein